MCLQQHEMLLNNEVVLFVMLYSVHMCETELNGIIFVNVCVVIIL